MKPFFLRLFFIAALFFTFQSIFGQEKRLSYYDSTKTMPPFTFYLSDGAIYTSDSLSKKNTTIMIYYKTDCPYCAKEADIIAKNINDLLSADFIFISREDTAAIRSFAVMHHLENNNRVKFLQDKDKKYYQYYVASYTPSIHIYDRNKRLKLFIEGILSKEELLKNIQ